MKYHFWVFIALFIMPHARVLVAQVDNIPGQISWGEDLSEPANTRITKIISTGSFGFYALRQKNAGAISEEQAYVELYDSENKLQRSEKLDLKYKGKQRDFEDVLHIGGQLYFFTSFNNQAQKTNYLFYQTLNSRLQASKNLEKIAEVPAPNKVKEGAFNLLVSKDSSKLLLYSQLPYKKKESERFALHVFDNQMQALWKKEVALPYNDQQFSVEGYRIDNQGNVYLLGLLYLDGVKDVKRGKPNYQYIILAYTSSGDGVQEYRLEIEDKFITDLNFRIADNAHLVCAGFYSDKGTLSVKGTCFFKIDPANKEVYDLSLQEFDFEFRSSFGTNAQQRKAAKNEASGDPDRQPELYRFSLDKIVLRSDGGALLVAEQFYVFERTYRYWDGTTRVDYFYHYNDIIVVNLNPTGEIEWASRIPKRQETMNDGGYFSSYAMAIVKDRIFFIFNDNSRNFENDNSRFIHNFNGRNSVISLAELTKDGELKIFPLFFNRDADIITRPTICKQTGSRKMLIYGELGRGYRFATLNFD